MRFTGKITLAANTPRTGRQLILAAIDAWAFLTADERTAYKNQFSRFIVATGEIRNNSASTAYLMQNPKNLDSTPAQNPQISQANISGVGHELVPRSTDNEHSRMKLDGMDLNQTVISSSGAIDLFIDVLFC